METSKPFFQESSSGPRATRWRSTPTGCRASPTTPTGRQGEYFDKKAEKNTFEQKIIWQFQLGQELKFIYNICLFIFCSKLVFFDHYLFRDITKYSHWWRGRRTACGSRWGRATRAGMTTSASSPRRPTWASTPSAWWRTLPDQESSWWRTLSDQESSASLHSILCMENGKWKS